MADGEHFEGWKQISDYLQKSPRTVQNWYRLKNLPVRKLGGRVVCLKSELDAWVAAELARSVAVTEADEAPEPDLETVPATPVGEPAPQRRRFAMPRQANWIAIAGLVLATAGASLRLRPKYREPVTFRVEARMLRTFAADGSLVWERPIPFKMSNWHADYPERPIELYQSGIFVDLNGDGRKELLFVPEAETQVSTTLYCFAANGDIAWQWIPGHRIHFSGAVTNGPWVTNVLAVIKSPRQDGGRIVVGSHHGESWPEQIALLTGTGKQVAEYWHPGWIFQMEIADLDNDGTDEIILGGVNDGFSGSGYGPTIVVLDSRRIFGQAPVPPGDRHTIEGVASGDEAAILLLPEFNRVSDLPSNYCRIERYIRFREGLLTARVGKGGPEQMAVNYEFNRHFQIVNITPDVLYNHTFLANLSPPDRASTITRRLGTLKVLRNRFAVPES